MRAVVRVELLALVFALAFALACSGRAALAQDAPAVAAARAIVLVHPESVTVGDPVTIVARVTVLKGATVGFPVAVGVDANVEALDPRLVQVRAIATGNVFEATWRVIGWRPGVHALPLGEAVVTMGAQAVRLPLETRMLVVRSVLPVDTAKRVPRPARGLIAIGTPWYERWWLVAIALAAGFLAHRAWKRRRSAPAPAPEVEAMRSFDRLQLMGLAVAGEPAREVALAAGIVRAALEARWPDAGRGLTTAQVTVIAHGHIGPLAGDIAAVLADADLVKFARRPVSAEGAQAYTTRARRVLVELGARMPRAGKAA